jgi:gamma-glutamyl hercynylcysteine S-oxide hydrolase
MCRLLAYWGAPVPATRLVVDPAHSLLVQVSASRLQTSGHVNPDGWGYATYERHPLDPSPTEVPVRYRSALAMTDDADGLAGLASVTAERFIAHVRHKSPGSPTEVAGSAPFVRGALAFAHNGFVAGYRQGRREQLRAQLSAEVRSSIQGDADSEVLFGLLIDRLAAGADLASATAALVMAVADWDGDGTDQSSTVDFSGGKFNLVVSDGQQLVATRWGNSLFVRHDRPAPGAVIVASEPFDDETDWQEVPDRTLVRVADGTVAFESLGHTTLEANRA